MAIQWATGDDRSVWANGGTDEAALWQGLRLWEEVCGIRYIQAASPQQAQVLLVDYDEGISAFGIEGDPLAYAWVITHPDGSGRVAYLMARDDVSPWPKDLVLAHEAGHAEGAADNPADAIMLGEDSIYRYDQPWQTGLAQYDIAKAIERHGPNPAGTEIHCGRGSYGAVSGGGGDDTIWGQGGADRLYGNLGKDVLDGGADADTLYGGQGADAVSGGDGDDVLYGNLAADLLRGDGGADTLFGGQGNDTLSGGAGNDVLYGNLGADVLVGGAGADTIHVGEDDTVVGFEIGVDVLVLAGQGPPAFAAASDWVMA